MSLSPVKYAYTRSTCMFQLILINKNITVSRRLSTSTEVSSSSSSFSAARH